AGQATAKPRPPKPLPMAKPEPQKRRARCLFCSEEAPADRIMVGDGVGTNICENCVAEAVKVIEASRRAKRGEPTPQGASRPLGTPQDRLSRPGPSLPSPLPAKRGPGPSLLPYTIPQPRYHPANAHAMRLSWPAGRLAPARAVFGGRGRTLDRGMRCAFGLGRLKILHRERARRPRPCRYHDPRNRGAGCGL